MSETLGEKLRLAREERGISLTEVAEQTRISPHYLQAIEVDNYQTLPGGIFNKGFVRSYAKYVGIDENEALADYSRLINAGRDEPVSDEPKVYRPEVLTDDRTSGSLVPTVITALVVLGLLTAAILFGLNYLNRPAEPVVANNATPAVTPTGSNTNSATPADPSTPSMASLNVEVKALTAPVKIVATVDAEPPKASNISAGSSATFTPKESLTLNYIRWNASAVQLTINGKAITLPAEPLDAKDRDRIIFTISKDTLPQIWSSGSISTTAQPAVTDANVNAETDPTAASTTPPVRSTPVKPVSTPAATPKPEAANKPPATPATLPTRKVIVVGNANRPQ